MVFFVFIDCNYDAVCDNWKYLKDCSEYCVFVSIPQISPRNAFLSCTFVVQLSVQKKSAKLPFVGRGLEFLYLLLYILVLLYLSKLPREVRLHIY